MCATFKIFPSRRANQMASVNKWQSGNLVELADNAFPLLVAMEVERSPSKRHLWLIEWYLCSSCRCYSMDLTVNLKTTVF